MFKLFSESPATVPAWSLSHSSKSSTCETFTFPEICKLSPSKDKAFNLFLSSSDNNKFLSYSLSTFFDKLSSRPIIFSWLNWFNFKIRSSMVKSVETPLIIFFSASGFIEAKISALDSEINSTTYSVGA